MVLQARWRSINRKVERGWRFYKGWPRRRSYRLPTVLAQQAGGNEGDERQKREHCPHAVPEVPRVFVSGSRARQLARRRVGGDASKLLVQRDVDEDGQQEAAPHVEHAGQRDEPESARAGSRGVHHERRHKEQDGAEEAEEEQRVLYPLVDRLHGSYVRCVGLCSKAEVDRDRVGVEDAGYETRGEGSAGQRESADGRPARPRTEGSGARRIPFVRLLFHFSGTPFASGSSFFQSA